MEKRTTSLEDHLSIVESSHNKTASPRARMSGDDGESLIDKIARELEKGAQEAKPDAAAADTTVGDGGSTAGLAGDPAPKAEGEVTPADSSVAGANMAVVAATEAVATPQTTIAGGNPAEAAAGEQPAATKVPEGLAISAGDGQVTDANNLHRTPEAVAAAAQFGGGDEGSAAYPKPDASAVNAGDNTKPGYEEKTASEANQIGKMIANSFLHELEKSAKDHDYAESLALLKEAGLLEGYNIKEPEMSKQASVPTGCLEKIANRKSLTKEEIIGAAYELLDLEKQAADAEAQGREDARALVNLVSEIQKEANENQDTAGKESEKVASALNDADVVSAVKTLKAKGLL